MYKALAFILLSVPLSLAADAPAIKLRSPEVVVRVVAPALKVGEFQVFGLDNYTGSITWELEGDCVKLHELKEAVKRIDWPDGADAPVMTDIASGTLIIRGQSAGTAKLSAWGVIDGKAKKLASKTIIVEGASPKPDPKPDPKPQPYTGKLRLLIIEETEQAANNRGAFFNDEPLATYLREKCSHRPRIVDQDTKDVSGNPPLDIAPWLALAKGKKLPQWFVLKPTGEILLSGDMPDTPAKLLAALKGVAGE